MAYQTKCLWQFIKQVGQKLHFEIIKSHNKLDVLNFSPQLFQLLSFVEEKLFSWILANFSDVRKEKTAKILEKKTQIIIFLLLSVIWFGN